MKVSLGKGFGIFAIMLLGSAWPALADGHDPVIKSHGYSFFGDLKYPADFKHLDYVNPNAPKGGEISQWSGGTFDSFTP